MRKNLVYPLIALAVVVAAAIALSTNLNVNNSNATSNPTAKASIPQTMQLQINVVSNGNWSGTYADTPISAPSAVSINGSGNKTITIDRPSDCQAQWVISAQAQKQSVDNEILIISITKMDGTVLSLATSKTNEPALMTVIVEN